MLKTFRIGGIHPNEHKLTAHCPVTPVAVPRQVAIMLNQHIGAPANCIVKKGDTVTLDMPMEAKLMEANPLVEECRGQVAVQRGPIIYCIESNDLNGADIDNIAIPANAKFTPVETTIEGSRIIALETEAVNRGESSWQNTLYREIGKNKNTVKIRLIPYYAWGNRGKSEMTVWIPVEL